MDKYESTGGARIGMANASFPFAKLKVTNNKLELNVSMIGNLVFSPADIVSIEPYQQIPIIGRGVKINHSVSNYKEKVIFWTFGNPKEVIDEIRKTGFLDNLNSKNLVVDNEILEKQKQGGFPIKKSFAIGAVVLWNLLILIDFVKFFNGPRDGFLFSYGVKTALGLFLGLSLLTLVSKSFQNLILKEGRSLDDIKRVLYFIILITSFMLFNIMMISSFK